MRMELISFSFKDWFCIFNIHNATQIPADFDQKSQEYIQNHHKMFPRKHWNEMNIFAVKNDKEKGTELVEMLDK